MDVLLKPLRRVAVCRYVRHGDRVHHDTRVHYNSLLDEANEAVDTGNVKYGEHLEKAARELETWVPPRPPAVDVTSDVAGGAWWMDPPSETPLSQAETPLEPVASTQSATTPRRAFGDTTPPPTSHVPRSRSRSPPTRTSGNRRPYRRSRSRSQSPGTSWFPASPRFNERTGMYEERAFYIPVTVAERCRNGGKRWHLPIQQHVHDLDTVSDVVRRALRRLRIANMKDVVVTRPHDVAFSDTVANAAARCKWQCVPALCVMCEW